MATLYIEGEKTYTIEDSEKVVSVMVDRKMYALSPEAMDMFENIHDEWELNICEKYPHDLLIEGTYVTIILQKIRETYIHPGSKDCLSYLKILNFWSISFKIEILIGYFLVKRYQILTRNSSTLR